MAILKVARLGNPVLRKPAAEVPVSVYRGARFPAARRRHGRSPCTSTTAWALPPCRSTNPCRWPCWRWRTIPAIRARVPCPFRSWSIPTVTPLGDDTEEDWEGCLSIPEIRGLVPRYKRLRVTALDREGNALDFRRGRFPRPRHPARSRPPARPCLPGPHARPLDTDLPDRAVALRGESINSNRILHSAGRGDRPVAPTSAPARPGGDDLLHGRPYIRVSPQPRVLI